MSIVERIQGLHYITDEDGCCCAGCDEAWPCAESRAAELLQRAAELLKRGVIIGKGHLERHDAGEYVDCNCDAIAARALIEEIERE